MRILIVEDEIHLGEALAQIVRKHNYTVDVVYDGEDGLDYGMSGIYDVIVLDIMLPKMDGITVLKKLREAKIQTPVILLTAKADISDKVKGLDSGADDYLAKPFNTEELLARVRALGRRRGEVSVSNDITFEDISLDKSTLTLRTENKEIKLTLKESELLEHLIAHKDMVSTKENIIEKLWGFDTDAEPNHVEVYISFLRKKLKFLSAKTSIITIRGVGYKLV